MAARPLSLLVLGPCALSFGPTPWASAGEAPPAAHDELSSALASALGETGHAAVWQVGTPLEGVAACWQAPNRARGLRTYFTERGVRLRPFGGELEWSFGATLVGLGRGDVLDAPPEPTLEMAGSRAEYRRGALVEWYVNDARGLEQGFTLDERPGGCADEPLRIVLEIVGDLRPRLGLDSRSVRYVDGQGRTRLRYEGLVAWDAAGTDLEAWISLAEGGLEISVDDSGANYPVVVDPILFTENGVLAPSVPEPNQTFGRSIATDGDTVVIGADTADSSTGVAYVFVRDGPGWTEEARLQAHDGQGSPQLFAFTLDISGDVVVVGASLHSHGDIGGGAAYVFRRTGTIWAQEQELLASDAALGDSFGYGVSIDGSTIAVGAAYDDDLGSGSGSAYVFTHDGSSWVEAAKLTASDGDGADTFGTAVRLEGSRLYVGAPRDDDSGSSSGSAYVFEGQGGSWVESAKLLASDGSQDAFFGLSLAADHQRVVVGAPFADEPQAATGAVYVFAPDAGIWTQEAKLTASDGGNALFGHSVAVASNRILVGAPYHHTSEGAAYLFEHRPTGWIEWAKLVMSSPSPYQYFGTAIGLSGETAFSSAPHENQTGLVLTFELPFQFESYCFGDGSGTPCPCGNESSVGADAGCENSQGTGGIVRARSLDDARLDDLVVEANSLVPNQPALLFAGEQQVAQGAGVPFGDGLRCAGGNVVRLDQGSADAAGAIQFGPGLARSGDFDPGESRYVQVWYRDPQAGPCGSGFNLTNGLHLQFGP